MSQDTERTKTKAERIARLRTRLQRVASSPHFGAYAPLVAVLAGVLDLLEDEL